MKFLLFAHYQFYTYQKGKLFKGKSIHVYTAIIDAFLLASLFTGLLRRFVEPQILKGLWFVLFAIGAIVIFPTVKKESFNSKCEAVVKGLKPSNVTSLNFILGVAIFLVLLQFFTVVLGW